MPATLDALWVEKYRPESLDTMALAPDDRALLKGFVEKGEIPHLLLSGPPGTGKTTTAKILYRALDCQVLVLNASDERGIDAIRNKVGTFVRTQSSHRWNCVMLDEADHLTVDAQGVLRNMMESFVDVGRFILTCNYLYKIISPLQSRCMRIELSQIPVGERLKILVRILQAEGVAIVPAVVMSYAQKFTDLRKMIMAAQRCVASKGQLVNAQETTTDGTAFLAFVQSKNWTGLREATALPGFDPQNALREMFWAVPETFAGAAEWRLRIGRGLRDTQTAPDPVIDFLAVCAELMTL